jgi:CheY-like chemotaxis protein
VCSLHSTAIHHPAASPRVLVVDADDDTRALYRQSLTLAGCSVVEAADGREALVKALTRRPALVVMELRLPLIDGVSLCQILRQDRTTADVPILVVTAEARVLELERMRRAGADAVLVKPSTPEAILTEMHRLLARSTIHRPLPSGPDPTGRRTALVKAHQRVTTTAPAVPPPDLVCPVCGRPLKYEQTYIGGMSNRYPERWDYFLCGDCGRFQYRHRTRKVRQI